MACKRRNHSILLATSSHGTFDQLSFSYVQFQMLDHIAVVLKNSATRRETTSELLISCSDFYVKHLTAIMLSSNVLPQSSISRCCLQATLETTWQSHFWQVRMQLYMFHVFFDSLHRQPTNFAFKHLC